MCRECTKGPAMAGVQASTRPQYAWGVSGVLVSGAGMWKRQVCWVSLLCPSCFSPSLDAQPQKMTVLLSTDSRFVHIVSHY